MNENLIPISDDMHEALNHQDSQEISTDLEKKTDEEEFYTVYINNPELNDNEENNFISTSKYKWYIFFPKTLLVEFSRLSNCYFLVLAIFQTIKEISYSSGNPLILIPLTFIMCLNGIKDLYEDFRRKESDKKENNALCQVFDSISNRFIKKKCYTIKPGDIVKVLKDEQIPADLLLLTTSEETGFCYVETKNIDGETSLKIKESNSTLFKKIKKDEDLSSLKYLCITKPPNEFIYKFDATLYEANSNGTIKDIKEFIFIEQKSFLLRACTLRQTDYIIGVAIYVGEHTKSMINAPKVKTKISKVEYTMNKQIIIVFIIQVLISIISSFIHVIMYIKDFKDLKSYIYTNQNKKENLLGLFFKIAGTWYLVMTNIVPISLLVSMEMIKFVQSWIIGWDLDMFDSSKRYGCKVQSSTLNEELGQIKYIFTDKTGTLTKNQMNFKMMSIGADVYNSVNSNELEKKNLKDKYGEIKHVDFHDENNKFRQDMNDENKKDLINHFMINLCLCNSVIIDRKLFKNSSIINYQASSPDEISLVNFGRSQNYIFFDRTPDNYIILEVKEQKLQYKILNILEYSSERKRMSIICETPKGEIIQYIKGADSTIEKLLNQNSKSSIEFQKTKQYLNQFSLIGLRTLMLAYKKLSKEEYTLWKNKYEEIIKSPNHKDEDIFNLYDEIENNFNIIGSTAIEDQLQDEVGNIIDSFISIGIKVWMLTGDKYETAKNVAYSCKLFQNDINVFLIGEYREKKELKNRLKTIYDKNCLENKNNNNKFGLILAGNELEQIFLDQKLLTLFSKICDKCTSAILCRASPKQKAKLVKLIKTIDGAITMAIGDGANDVGMITESNVGIGIQGFEGTQAARASDFSINQFSHLKKLLFFHGREYYRRNTWVIGYNFYKNFLYSSPVFWAGMITEFSGVTIYDPWILTLFNMIFVSLPCSWYAVCSLEFPQEVLISHPEYYKQGIEGKCFSYTKFITFISFAFGEGFLIYILGYYWFYGGNKDGTMDDFYAVGTAVYGVIIFVSNLRVVLQNDVHHFWGTMIVILSNLSFFVTVFLMSSNYILPSSMIIHFYTIDNWKKVMLDFKFALFVLLSSTICYFIEICSNNYPKLFFEEEKDYFNTNSKLNCLYIDNEFKTFNEIIDYNISNEDNED